MEIRRVKESEVGRVLDLIDGYDRPQAQRPSTDKLQAIYSSITQSGGCIVGAFVDHDMIGTCTINLCPNLSWSGRPYAILENVIVSEAHRDQGFGKALLQWGKEFVQRAGCYKVVLMTGSKDPKIHNFYVSAGFRANKQCYQVRFSA